MCSLKDHQKYAIYAICSDALFYRQELKPREEKGYFFEVDQKVSLGQVGTGPQNLLDAFTSSVLSVRILDGSAFGGISVFESWLTDTHKRQDIPGRVNGRRMQGSHFQWVHAPLGSGDRGRAYVHRD